MRLCTRSWAVQAHRALIGALREVVLGGDHREVHAAVLK